MDGRMEGLKDKGTGMGRLTCGASSWIDRSLYFFFFFSCPSSEGSVGNGYGLFFSQYGGLHFFLFLAN